MLTDTRCIRPMRKFWILAFSIILLSFAAMVTTVNAQTAEDSISGFPEVIDADILKFGQQRVILWGVDAPERPQMCWMNGAVWGCHSTAKRQLQLLAGRGEVTCELMGEPDPFGRRFGVCTSGGEDLNAEFVKSGLALAFEEQSDVYIPQMIDAITAGVGLWQVGVVFEEPWVFRRRETPGGQR